MEPVYDLWHLAFTNLVQQRAPPNVEVLSEETTMAQKIEEMPGYDDTFEKILEELPPEKRLLGLTAEQRVADLPEEQRLLLLSDDTLRQLPDSYFGTLSAGTQEIIRRRIGRPPAS